MQNAMLYWSEFGDAPHQLFDDPEISRLIHGYTVDQFNRDLSAHHVMDWNRDTANLYRFCLVQEGDVTDGVLELKDPTSWSGTLQDVMDTADGQSGYILELAVTPELKGALNQRNVYDEDEYILPPLRLQMGEVTSRPNGITYVIVTSGSKRSTN